MKHILRRRQDGFDVFVKDDGVDHWRLARACMRAGIDQKALIAKYPECPVFSIDDGETKATATPLAYTNPKRLVLRVEAGDRTYVLKRACMGSPGFKRLFPWVTGMTYFTRIMRKVDAAVRAGCAATQDVYLVAERWLSPFRQEVWVLLQYIEGDGNWRSRDGAERMPDADRRALRQTAEELLRHNLTMDDLAPGNFVRSAGGFRAIDISCRPFTRLQKAKMMWKLNARYELELPVRGLSCRLLYAFLSVRYGLLKALGKKVE